MRKILFFAIFLISYIHSFATPTIESERNLSKDVAFLLPSWINIDTIANQPFSNMVSTQINLDNNCHILYNGIKYDKLSIYHDGKIAFGIHTENLDNLELYPFIWPAELNGVIKNGFKWKCFNEFVVIQFDNLPDKAEGYSIQVRIYTNGEVYIQYWNRTSNPNETLIMYDWMNARIYNGYSW